MNPRPPSHLKVVKIGGQHTSSGATLQHPGPRPSGTTHVPPSHQLPYSLFQVEVTQKRNQELPGGQKVSPHHHHLV